MIIKTNAPSSATEWIDDGPPEHTIDSSSLAGWSEFVTQKPTNFNHGMDSIYSFDALAGQLDDRYLNIDV